MQSNRSLNFTISHRQLVSVNENVSFCTNELICVILGYFFLKKSRSNSKKHALEKKID